MKKLLLAILGVIGMGSANADSPHDFSSVDSREKAVQLAQEGKLFKVLLFPAEFGGEDVPQNIVYVPAGIPEIKDKITGTFIRFVQEGLIDNLQVNPEYKGNSFVPSKINMKTSHSGKAGEFNPTIEIW
ncbi:conserved hypothetical protein [Teredinibacter turnerae T7901]|uniref:Uncharacterized protein n=1 Tax=Teredinibacter turnerae (strain ATCC 39867 / T7901) TaxID=377629 RepID=C5BJ67_TERTT|nr:hypothetical protein [Teredinibacter turnerae]ACR10988.1 conserved hypothetical protein [Teredinibacter turnerae T7901]